jgi:hypothetical protein
MAYDLLTTVNSLKSWLKVTGSNDDAEFGSLIRVSSENIGRYCGRSNLGKVENYTESYFKRGNSRLSNNDGWDLFLRHYPVVALTSIMMNNGPLTVLNPTMLQANNSGVYLVEDDEPRILKFCYLTQSWPITVSYTAGYGPGSIPFPLQQAANAYAAEIFRSADWIGRKSVAIGGETTTFDVGSQWGMSDRLMAMLMPYRNVNPFMGFG